MRLALATAVLSLAALAGCGSASVRDLPAPLGPARVVASLGDRGSVVLLGRERALELRDARGRRLGRAPAGVGPTDVACARRWCYVTDARGEALLVFAVGSGIEATRRLYLPGDPDRVVVDHRRHRLLVTLAARGEVVELPAHGRPHVLRRRWPSTRRAHR